MTVYKAIWYEDNELKEEIIDDYELAMNFLFLKILDGKKVLGVVRIDDEV